MEMNLSGRVVLITGAARGIGAAAVRAFAKEGAWVAAIDRDVRAGESLAKSVDKMVFFEADLDDPKVMQHSRHTIVEAV